MSLRHDEAFRNIRREHDDVVAALRRARAEKKRGAPGNPAYDPSRLDIATVTAGDAYSLLLIATAEFFLREYLTSIGANLGSEPRLGMLIDRGYKELNLRTIGARLRTEEKLAMHGLREGRNAYAHGHRRSVFPSVPKVESIVSKFLSAFP